LAFRTRFPSNASSTLILVGTLERSQDPAKYGQDNGITEQLAAASHQPFGHSAKTGGATSRRVYTAQALLQLTWEI
jgi:hypothetical protein